ncbi:MAG: DUF58 domain-containing protein [Gammaproteobacteria bacterium]|nr:DUF58 domain-containing protein [Gammaproteobacteria bacterium]
MPLLETQIKPGVPPDGEGLVTISPITLVKLRQDARHIQLMAARSLNRSGGAYLSRFRGRGMEFDEVRPYQAGDDIRTLDWRVTARSGKPHTKLFREERERSVILWVDFRSPMYFGTRGMFKSVLASRAAAILGWSARNQGDKLGGLLFSEQGHRELRPASGDRAVLSLIGQLSDYTKRKARMFSPEQRTEAIRSALSRIRRVTRPGSLLCLISDFRDLNPSCERHLAALSQHNDLMMIQLHDPLEQELPKAGWYRISDDHRSIGIHTGRRELREHYRQQFDDRCMNLNNLCRRYGIHRLTCATDGDIKEQLKTELGRRSR